MAFAFKVAALSALVASGTFLAVWLSVYLLDNWNGEKARLLARLRREKKERMIRGGGGGGGKKESEIEDRLAEVIQDREDKGKRPKAPRFIHRHISSLIGNTPILELCSLSRATGCTILAKCEFLNPGGSAKDRLALQIITDAYRKGQISGGSKGGVSKDDNHDKRGGTICEGTVGSTGISLAMLCQSFGLGCFIAMPSDTSREKSDLLEAMGAEVERVKPASIIDPAMYVNRAREKAKSINRGSGIFADQFETDSNFWVHYTETGPEIWEQVGSDLDAVVLGAGTGGTIAGVSSYLHEKNPHIVIALADPQGSSLFNLVNSQVCHAAEQNEGKRKRHQTDTIVEGIGLQRVTKSLALGLDEIDRAIRIDDQRAIGMSRFLLKQEGLFLGPSSAVLCAAAVDLARSLGPGHVILTMLCDSGSRYLGKFWNDSYLKKQGFDTTESILNFQ